jgi:two-component system, NarL family, response regulator DesR
MRDPDAGPDVGPRRRGDLPLVVAVQPALWCELLCSALGGEPGMRIIAGIASEDELRASLPPDEPAIVILDYEAFGPNSEGLIARLHRAAPRARVLVLARRSGAAVVRSVLRVGAAGLVGKEASLATLVDAIRAVSAGQVWANREVTAQVLDQLASPAGQGPEDQPALTRRELEVLDAISRGLRNREIARRLGVSEKTVKTHLSNIFTKTGLRGRFALALWAQGQLQPKT